MKSNISTWTVVKVTIIVIATVTITSVILGGILKIVAPGGGEKQDSNK